MFEKYSEYKDSGVKWMGIVPKDWNVLANKYIFSIKKNLVGSKSKEYDLLSLTLGGIIKRDMLNPQGKFPAEFDTYQEVKQGDFVFCLFDVEETPRTVGLSDFDGMITGAYTVMEPLKTFDRKFLYYFYLNLDNGKRLRGLYTGLRNTISKENFMSFKALVPSFSEQTAIANFLDRKMAQIDQAISIKEKQIELLKERKQILIHNAVTRGLDQDVKMKDSGVEWIGEIPEHWQVVSLKRISSKITDGEHISPTFTDSGMQFLSAKDVREGFVEFPNNKFVSLKDGKKFRQRCNPQINDVLLVSRGATIGRVAKVATTEEFCLLGSVILLKPNASVLCDFLLGAMQNVLLQQHLLNTSHFSAQQALYLVNIINVQIALPALDEQKTVINYIDNINQKIATAISLKQKEIEKIKEYKSTLINSAVTGKIKVF